MFRDPLAFRKPTIYYRQGLWHVYGGGGYAPFAGASGETIAIAWERYCEAVDRSRKRDEMLRLARESNQRPQRIRLLRGLPRGIRIGEPHGWCDMRPGRMM